MNDLFGKFQRSSERHGVLWLYAPNETSDDRIVASRDDLLRAKTIVMDLSFGKAIDLRYDLSEERLALRFSAESEFWEEAPYLIGIPVLSVGGVRCVRCGQWYRSVDRPCECLRKSFVIAISGIIIENARIFDARNENNNISDSRDDFLNRFFASAVGGIRLASPI